MARAQQHAPLDPWTTSCNELHMLNSELRKVPTRYLRPFRLPCAPLGPPRWGALGAAEVLACSVSSAFTPDLSSDASTFPIPCTCHMRNIRTNFTCSTGQRQRCSE